MQRQLSWIEIDLNQLRKNIKLIKQWIYPRKYCLPIKANAYGHGLVEIAKASEEVDYFAVSSLQEGIELRQADIKKPILVLGGFLEDQISDLIAYDLEFSISSLFKAELVEQFLKGSTSQAKVHLKLETGMQRTGSRPQTAEKIYHYLKASQNFEIKGIYSHLACAETPNHPFNAYQKKVFAEFLDKISFADDLLIHLSNSAGVISQMAPFENMVRPGLLTFGISAMELPQPLLDIESFFSLKSRVSYFKVVEPGCGIGYNHTFLTQKQSRISTVPIGYGDGYWRCLSNQAHVLIRGKKYPICGQICMDQLMVNIGEGEAYVGDEVVLIGAQKDQKITLNEISKMCQTIPYEILCHFNERLERYYINRHEPACALTMEMPQT